MIVRKHIIFRGRVQGVGFRYHSTYKAENLGLTGWVRNCYDGSVEMEVQGDPDKINDLILYLQAQRFIQIEEMDEKKIPLQEEETAFRDLSLSCEGATISALIASFLTLVDANAAENPKAYLKN